MRSTTLIFALRCSLVLLIVGAAMADYAAADIVGFTGGNLAVVRVGTGAATLANASTAAFIEERTTAAGALVGSAIALPIANGGTAPAQNALTLNGTSTSEGFLQISTNGQYLTMAGYAAAPGAANVAANNAVDVNRTVGRVTISNGSLDTTTRLTASYNGSNIRGAVTTNGTDIWTSGNAGSSQGATAGVQYTTLGSASSVRIDDGTGGGSNDRVVNIFNNQLYVSANSSPRLAIQQIGTGTPMTGSQTVTTLPGMPITGTHSAYDYWFKTGDPNTVYLADDGATATGNGIQKWTLSAGTWTLQYTLLNNGTTSTDVVGLAGYVAANGDVVLFGTNSTQLFSVTDTGVDNDTMTWLVTAAANTNFRGIEFIPVPEVSSFALVGLVGFGTLLVRRLRRGRRQ